MPRPYKLYGKTESDSIKAGLTVLVNNWKTRWFVANTDSISVNIESTYQHVSDNGSQSGDYYSCVINDQAIDVIADTKSLNELLIRIINTPANLVSRRFSDISRMVVDKCILDLISTIARHDNSVAGALVLTEAAEPPEVNINSGLVSLTLLLGLEKIFFFIPYEITRLLISKRVIPVADNAKSLYMRSACKITANTRLAIMAGRTELDYGTVTNLCVGDVIRLDSKIDEPLDVTLADGSQVCKAFIGRKENHKVAKVILGK